MALCDGCNLICLIRAVTRPAEIKRNCFPACFHSLPKPSQLWRIQLPNIWLVFSFVMFDCIRGTLQCFDIPFIMTNGGPGYASSTFTLYTIDTAFKYNSFGMAATMAVAIMAIVILVYVFQNVVLKKVFNQEEAA